MRATETPTPAATPHMTGRTMADRTADQMNANEKLKWCFDHPIARPAAMPSPVATSATGSERVASEITSVAYPEITSPTTGTARSRTGNGNLRSASSHRTIGTPLDTCSKKNKIASIDQLKNTIDARIADNGARHRLYPAGKTRRRCHSMFSIPRSGEITLAKKFEKYGNTKIGDAGFSACGGSAHIDCYGGGDPLPRRTCLVV